MTPAWTTRRRAEEFDALVEGRPDGLGTGSARGLEDPRFADLLEVVGAVRSLPRPEPRATFSADLRERLMAEADTVLVPRDRSVEDRLALPVRESGRRERRLAAAAGAFVLVGATSSMAVASQGALPGETLYPVKRAIEGIRTDVTLDDAAKARTLLAHASDRLAEATELAQQDGRGTDSVPATLDDFNAQANEGASLLLDQYDETGDEAHIGSLRDFTATSMADLQLLESSASADADDDLADALRDAAEAVQRLDAAAVAACPTCGDGVVAIPQGLAVAAPDPSADEDPVRPGGAAKPRPPKASPSASVPEIGPDLLPPGSVTGPSAPALPGAPTPTGTAKPGPLTEIIGGGSDGTKSPLGGLLAPVTEAVDGLTAGLGLDLGPLLGLDPAKPKSSPQQDPTP